MDSLEAEIAVLKNKLADKDAVITERDSAIADKDSAIAEKDSAINKLTIDLDAARFQNEQLRRMIFGSKRERFESNDRRIAYKSPR